MATFTTARVVQHLDDTGTPSWEGDAEPVIVPMDADYTADLPASMHGVYNAHPFTTSVQFASPATFAVSPSPFMLVADSDPNQVPSTRAGLDPGFN